MNKTLKTILIYVGPLLIGIGLAVIFYKLETSGRKNVNKAYVNSWINVGPDSLINHFPDTELLKDATFSIIAPQDKKEIGGGFVNIWIEKSDTIENFIISLESDKDYLNIKKETIFNADLNYKERKYEITNFNEISEYPFPNFINNENFDNYKILFYDFGKGKYLDKNHLKENSHINSNWKHGYTRGIVLNQENEYEMWLIIW